MDVPAWLTKLGFEEFIESFVDNGVDGELLGDLTNDDLKDLGVARLADRKRLLKAIDQLRGEEAQAPNDGVVGTPIEAERRQVTVIFCDLVGSTALSAKFDPEDYREVIRAYQDACAGIVKQFGGYLAKYMGDGILVYFGYPEAHEDDAERAINTGLGFVDAVAALGDKLAVRVGIATGTVVVGDIVGEGSAQEAAITGDAPNLAARLQALAEPDTVVIAETTRELAGNLFNLREIGERTIKGFADPILPCAVLGPRRIESRFDASHAEMLSELVGRDEELEILMRRWRRVQNGDGQIVLISGEAGIGKSRLARELRERIAGEPHTRLHYQCSPYHTGSALYPIIEHLERAAGFTVDDDIEAKLEKLERLIETPQGSVERIAPLLASLLSIPTGERYPEINVSPERRKELILEALTDQLWGLAAQRPVLFFLEDAHWVDPTTLELMELIVEVATSSAVFVLITYRPEFTAPWIGQPRVTPIILGRLERRDCAALVNRLAHGKPLPHDLLERITEQTDGVPLFVEELTKSVLETATSRNFNGAGTIDVPATLQDSLAARLDRLGTAKEVAQIGAVIGREFNYELLASVAKMDASALDKALARLSYSGLITRRGGRANPTYVFKHALVQSTAYNLLLRSRRAELHARVAECLKFGKDETAPEVLAFHLTEAGLDEMAVDNWFEAGRHAMQRSANLEAESHLRKGLSILMEMPESPERRKREVALLNTLGVCLMPVRGFGNLDVEDAFSRAANISEQDGDKRGLFVALRGKGQYQMISGDLATAEEQSAAILRLANDEADPDLLIEAHHLGWSALSFTGDFAAARRHAEAAKALYNPKEHHQLTYVYSGHDPGVCCRSFGSLALWQLGYQDQALAECLQGKALADELRHPFSIIVAWWALGMLRVLRREVGAARDVGEALIRDCNEMGIRPFVPLGRILCGGASAEQGDFKTGLQELCDGIDGMHAVRTEYTLTIFYAWLAELYLKADRLDEAEHRLGAGLAMCESNAERFCLPEFHRIAGEVLAARSSFDDAERSLGRAMDLAEELDSRVFGLRAAISLARIRRAKGKNAQARECLLPHYERFEEGFDTFDLKEAKTLLDELV